MNDFTLLGGTANRELAAAVASHLSVELGNCEIKRFPDSEISVQLHQSVRGQEIFIIQSTAPPVDSHLIELLALADACRRASARRIVAVVPYFGYARADKRQGSRQPIMASMVARLLEAGGIDHLMTVDLHAPQIEGFFNIPVDSLAAAPVFYKALEAIPQPFVVVSPDSGRIPMALQFAQQLSAPIAVLQKQRESGTQTEITHVIGEVQDKTCLIVDDIIATGGTLISSIEALLQAGARPQLTVAATHGLLIGDALEKLSHSNLHHIFVTDTVLVKQHGAKLQVVSISRMIAQSIAKMLKSH
ncbi:MAG: ribose-phosphate diphosphokinase [Cyanophyceae cyanobacterium]